MYIYTNTMYMPKNTISITEARRNIFKIANEVQTPDNHYILTENGAPKAVIISAEEFDSMQETIETMIDIPDLPGIIKEYEEDKKKNGFKNFISFDEVLKEYGYIKKPKSSKKNP